MRFLHTMIRVGDLDRALAFFCGTLGLQEVRRTQNEKARYTLVYLAAPE
ncbi:MAG: glyoxalase/bleomycin resistance protein/dioxygenase, partial [Methylocystaceae bacterium]